MLRRLLLIVYNELKVDGVLQKEFDVIGAYLLDLFSNVLNNLIVSKNVDTSFV